MYGKRKMNIKELMAESIKLLKQNNIADANIKSRVLLQYVLNVDKNYLLVHSDAKLDDNIKTKYMKYVKQLIQGKPLQYITKTQEFMGINFCVDENVLVPQPDTEILVEETIKQIENKFKTKEKVKVLDLCTGSGAIAVSIKKHFCNERKLEIYGLDISKQALNIAKINAKNNDVEIHFIESDMFEKMPNMKFDLIVSNPPYIETSTIKKLSNDVKNQPYIALNGGEDGLDFYRVICKESKKYLENDGVVLLEIGYNQKESVIKQFAENNRYKDIVCIKDLAGNDRVIICKNNEYCI